MLLPLLSLIAAYLLGSIPCGWLAGLWLAGIDLRERGSGSTGATNVLREVGKGPAVVVLLADVFKGTAAVLLTSAALGSVASGGAAGGAADAWRVAAAVAALAGHIWPIWLGWRGGKAVATGLGVLLGLAPAVALACLGVFLAVLTIGRIVSLASVAAALALPLLMLGWFHQGGMGLRWPYLLLALVTSALVLWRHRSNITRLLAGEEPHLGQKD